MANSSDFSTPWHILRTKNTSIAVICNSYFHPVPDGSTIIKMCKAFLWPFTVFRIHEICTLGGLRGKLGPWRRPLDSLLRPRAIGLTPFIGASFRERGRSLSHYPETPISGPPLVLGTKLPLAFRWLGFTRRHPHSRKALRTPSHWNAFSRSPWETGAGGAHWEGGTGRAHSSTPGTCATGTPAVPRPPSEDTRQGPVSGRAHLSPRLTAGTDGMS